MAQVNINQPHEQAVKRPPQAASILSTARIILCMHPANERRRYIVTSSLIGWAQTYNDPRHRGNHMDRRGPTGNIYQDICETVFSGA